MSTRYTAPESRAVVPTSVVSFGVRITIAAQRRELPFYPTPAWGPAVLLTGSSPSNVGGMTDIPGSRATDSPPMVCARSKTEVLVGWNHVGFSTNEQGIWTAWRTYGATGSATSAPVRRTRSAYDMLDGVGVDRRGRVYLRFRRHA